MRLFTRFEDLKRAKIKNAVVTLGTFDGIHRGHARVIAETVKRARRRGGKAVVLTFADHPLKVLAPKKAPPLITTLDQKLDLLRDLGVDAVMVLPFNRKESRVSAEDFIRKQVCASLGVKEFCLGPDTTFGRGGKGDEKLLKKMGERLGFSVSHVPRVYSGKLRLSSTAVRQAVQKGDLRRASKILGRPFAVRGTVIRGAGLGKKIGFPTANVRPETELVPPQGVYAVKVKIQQKSYPAVLNFGRRPTILHRGHPTLEAHILGFARTLYGKKVDIIFIGKLRKEKKFSNIQKLSLQITKDILKARRLFLSQS